MTELCFLSRVGWLKHLVPNLNYHPKRRYPHPILKVNYFQSSFWGQLIAKKYFKFLQVYLIITIIINILKVVAEYISDPLADLVNECLSTGQFPTLFLGPADSK